MAKKFRYKNGFVSVVSDKVAEILDKKGEGKALGEAPQKPAEEKAEGVKK